MGTDNKRRVPVPSKFFALFFLGTSVWFVPFIAWGWLRRWPQVPAVARMTLALVAAYYAYLGIVLLVAGRHHG